MQGAAAAAAAGGAGGGKAITGVKLQILPNKRPTADGDDTFNSIFPVENEELAYGRWEDEVIWDHEAMSTKLTPRMVSMDPNDDNIILGRGLNLFCVNSFFPFSVPLSKVLAFKYCTRQ